jgi:mannose-6-phosphate isomerase-like protein (cupin superfamily)
MEVFHILEAKPGAFVFLCDFSDWQRQYEPDRFRRWLAGGADEFFDSRAFKPLIGDVFIISSLGVVHSVFGCTLEEYATVSTDMVDRLYDQNSGSVIPSTFTRQYAERQLATLELPSHSRLVDAATWNTSLIDPISCRGGQETILVDSFVRASHRRVEAGAETGLSLGEGVATIVRIFAGTGRLWIADESEVNRLSDASIPVQPNDVFLIAPGMNYGFRNSGTTTLTYSQHQIDPKKALF